MEKIKPLRAQLELRAPLPQICCAQHTQVGRLALEIRHSSPATSVFHAMLPVAVMPRDLPRHRQFILAFGLSPHLYDTFV